MNKVKISIITVAYNAAKLIEKTIKSVINQTYNNIEYIIIDGGSTDGTIDIIKKYDRYLAYWISEPDKGIYDAMNKAIKKANGDWINFMNCGDTFVDENVISEIFQTPIENNINVVYGDTLLRHQNRLFVRKTKAMHGEFPNLCHQSTFSRTSTMKKNLFNLKYKIAADIDFFYKIYDNKSFQYRPLLIAEYDISDGLSANNPFLLRKEYAEIFNLTFNWQNKIKGLIFSLVKNLIPQKLYQILYITYLKNKSYITEYK